MLTVFIEGVTFNGFILRLKSENCPVLRKKQPNV